MKDQEYVDHIGSTIMINNEKDPYDDFRPEIELMNSINVATII